MKQILQRKVEQDLLDDFGQLYRSCLRRFIYGVLSWVSREYHERDTLELLTLALNLPSLCLALFGVGDGMFAGDRVSCFGDIGVFGGFDIRVMFLVPSTGT